MYPSDQYMVYGNGVNATCYTNPDGCYSRDDVKKGWVFNSNPVNDSLTNTWLLSPSAINSITVLDGDSTGRLAGHSVYYYSYGVRPVVYLSADIQIFDGDGSEQNPYKLKK